LGRVAAVGEEFVGVLKIQDVADGLLFVRGFLIVGLGDSVAFEVGHVGGTTVDGLTFVEPVGCVGAVHFVAELVPEFSLVGETVDVLRLVGEAVAGGEFADEVGAAFEDGVG
jgi:hypothetical protein